MRAIVKSLGIMHKLKGNNLSCECEKLVALSPSGGAGGGGESPGGLAGTGVCV